MKHITLSKYRPHSLVAKYQKGVTMIEYALLASLIAVVAILVITGVGTKINAIWTNINTAI
jgi:pilus assembly protein Flp/PilA